MKILVTGGAGYLGSTLVQYLLNQGHHVTVVDNFMYDQMPFGHLCNDPDLYIIKGDARDYRLMKPLLAASDVLIPLAAIVGAPACESDRSAALTTNYEAVNVAMKEMSREQRILVPITNSGYGNAGGAWCTEDTPLNPISWYGKTKVWAEQAVLDRGNSISFRLATVFGMSPRMRLDLLVNDFVYRAVNDKAVVLFEPHFNRNYIHVRDVAKVFIHGLANFSKMKDQVYNVGLSNANLSKFQLCERIAEYVPGFTFLTASIGEDPDKRDYLVSNEKIEATGWKPSHSLDSGIRELLKGMPMLRSNIHSNV